jgi:hypothetical protein
LRQNQTPGAGINHALNFRAAHLGGVKVPILGSNQIVIIGDVNLNGESAHGLFSIGYHGNALS